MKRGTDFGVVQTVTILQKSITTCTSTLRPNTLDLMDTIVNCVTKLVLPEMPLEFITFAITKINKINIVIVQIWMK